MIFFDTETTGLPADARDAKTGDKMVDTPYGQRIEDMARQPRIIEIAGIKTNDKLEEIARFTTLVNPGVQIPAEVTKIHGITDADVSRANSFPFVLKTHILPFWRGEETIIGYHVNFDLEMLWWELRRIGWEYRFPYCWDIVDAIQYRGTNGKSKRIKLNTWSEEVLGATWTPQTHRALGDCERLLACYRTLVG